MSQVPAAPLCGAVSRCPSSCGSSRTGTCVSRPLVGCGTGLGTVEFCAFTAARDHVASVAGSHVPLTTRAPRPRLQRGAVLVPLPVRPPGCLPLPTPSSVPPGSCWVCVFVGVGGESTSNPWLPLGLMAAGTDGAVGRRREHIGGRQRRGGDSPPCRPRPPSSRCFP